MNLEVGVRAHDELAVAERGEIREGVIGLEGLLGVEEELVAVAILRALPVVVELDGDPGVSEGMRRTSTPSRRTEPSVTS